MHSLSNKFLSTAPVQWQERGPLQRFLKRFQFTKKFNNHVHGMVGFVKQLVDELGIAEITGPNGVPKGQFDPERQRWSRFSSVLYTPGVVLVRKA